MEIPGQFSVEIDRLGRLNEARSAILTGLALNPAFSISRARAAWIPLGDDLDESDPTLSPFSKACARPEYLENDHDPRRPKKRLSPNATPTAAISVRRLTSLTARAYEIIICAFGLAASHVPWLSPRFVWVRGVAAQAATCRHDRARGVFRDFQRLKRDLFRLKHILRF